MKSIDVHDHDAIVARLREQAKRGAIRVTLHGHQEMVEENARLDEVQEVLGNAEVVENYPDHQRGSCCLVCARTSGERYLHVVCTTSLEVAIVVTVYEPKKPKWVTPFQRGSSG